jgi:predicted phosphodiesterase
VALDAVLADVARVGVDQIVCLGDVATLGPRPESVLATLRDLKCPCILGNHDEFMTEPELIRRYTSDAMIVDTIEWCRAQLSAEDIDFIRGSFARTARMDLGGGVSLSLYHGTPRSNTEDLLAETPSLTVDEMLADAGPADVYAGGHTHMQMLRQHRGSLIVNPGSLGMPFRAPYAGGRPSVMRHAEYATVEPGCVTLRRVELDLDAVRQAIASRDFPMRQALLSHFE